MSRGGDNYFEPGAGGERIPPAHERTLDFNITHVLHPACARMKFEVLSGDEVAALLTAYALLTDSRFTDARTPTVHGAAFHDGTVEKLASKNVASGYAGLDASLKLSGSQQVYGSAANTACEGNDARLLTYLDQPQRVMCSLLPNVGTSFTTISGTAYFVYLGRVAAAFTPKHVEFLVGTAGAGAQTAEVGIFSTPSGPNKASQSVTKLEASGTITSLITTGVKRNTTPFVTLVAAGTHLWAGIRTAMATTQPGIGGLTQDMSQGRILSTAASGVLTGTGPWTGAIIAVGTYLNTTLCPDLRLVVD